MPNARPVAFSVDEVVIMLGVLHLMADTDFDIDANMIALMTRTAHTIEERLAEAVVHPGEAL